MYGTSEAQIADLKLIPEAIRYKKEGYGMFNENIFDFKVS